MGKHLSAPLEPASRRLVLRTQRAPKLHHIFIRRGPGLFAVTFLIALGLLLVNMVDPYSGAVASPNFVIVDLAKYAEGQSLIAAEGKASSGRDAVTGVLGGAPAAGTPDPGSAQAIAYVLVIQRGWGGGEFNCLVSLWNRESHWNVNSHNSSSGAHGIPQALPGSKMASAGPDWATNPKTQILWGLGYIAGRYGTPCGAWNHSQETGWY
jgi:hypothetical protein